MFSLSLRNKIGLISLTVLVVSFSLILELNVLNHFTFEDTICNLPLTLTILWGTVFGSQLSAPVPSQIRVMTTWQVFARQAMRGSLSGFLVGAFAAALYASVVPIYPIAYPLIGWIAGYFSLQKVSRETLLCIPLVLLATVLAESLTAFQLSLIGRPDVFSHLSEIALPESLLNAIIAPFVYFPMRRFHDLSKTSGQVS